MLFDNTFENNYEELITYYPVFYRNVLEMRAILSAHGKIADDIMSGMERGFSNAFLTEADEEMIARYEAFLGLEAAESQTLEERRSLVISYFAGFGKLSASVLKNLLKSYTDGETQITFEPADDEGNNLLSIVAERGSMEKFSALDIMNQLARRLPAHLWYGLNVIYPEKLGLYFGFVCIILRDTDIEASSNEVIEDIEYLADENGYTLMDELCNVFGDGDEL